MQVLLLRAYSTQPPVTAAATPTRMPVAVLMSKPARHMTRPADECEPTSSNYRTAEAGTSLHHARPQNSHSSLCAAWQAASVSHMLCRLRQHNPPPESKHTPLPTSATNGKSAPALLLLLLLLGGCQWMSSTTGGLAAALPTVCTAGQLAASSCSPCSTTSLAPAGVCVQ
jgi:hypothetical protein